MERIRQEYIDRLEEQMRSYKVLDRLQRLQADADGEFGEASRKTLEDQLDKEIAAMMMGGEEVP